MGNVSIRPLEFSAANPVGNARVHCLRTSQTKALYFLLATPGIPVKTIGPTAPHTTLTANNLYFRTTSGG